MTEVRIADHLDSAGDRLFLGDFGDDGAFKAPERIGEAPDAVAQPLVLAGGNAPTALLGGSCGGVSRNPAPTDDETSAGKTEPAGRGGGGSVRLPARPFRQSGLNLIFVRALACHLVGDTLAEGGSLVPPRPLGAAPFHLLNALHLAGR